jgi:hypothetical protein
VQKPYTLDNLRDTLRACLGQPATSD